MSGQRTENRDKWTRRTRWEGQSRGKEIKDAQIKG